MEVCRLAATPLEDVEMVAWSGKEDFECDLWALDERSSSFGNEVCIGEMGSDKETGTSNVRSSMVSKRGAEDEPGANEQA